MGMVDGPQATAGNYLKLATLDLQFERKDAAAEAVQKGLALEPGNFDLLSQQWSSLAEAQKWTDCIALFDKLVAAAPNAYFVDQLEARQVQALTSAGQIDATEKSLRAKLGADPGLTEGELRMLFRIMVQKADADVPKVIDEAQRRFPQSVSLIRMEIDYNRHASNYDAAVAALQKLIETQPDQKGDWLTEVVHVRMDQGDIPTRRWRPRTDLDRRIPDEGGWLPSFRGCDDCRTRRRIPGWTWKTRWCPSCRPRSR